MVARKGFRRVLPENHFFIICHQTKIKIDLGIVNKLRHSKTFHLLTVKTK